MKRFLTTLALLLSWALPGLAQTSHLNVPVDNLVTILGVNDGYAGNTPAWSWTVFQHGSLAPQPTTSMGQFAVPSGRILVITDISVKTVRQARQDAEFTLYIGHPDATLGAPVFRRMLHGTVAPTWTSQQEFDFSMVSGVVVGPLGAIYPYLLQGSDGTTQPYRVVLSGYYAN